MISADASTQFSLSGSVPYMPTSTHALLVRAIAPLSLDLCLLFLLPVGVSRTSALSCLSLCFLAVLHRLRPLADNNVKWQPFLTLRKSCTGYYGVASKLASAARLAKWRAARQIKSTHHLDFMPMTSKPTAQPNRFTFVVTSRQNVTQAPRSSNQVVRRFLRPSAVKQRGSGMAFRMGRKGDLNCAGTRTIPRG
eukprot:6213907-Pleurochrysis_carterae.AAC.5